MGLGGTFTGCASPVSMMYCASVVEPNCGENSSLHSSNIPREHYPEGQSDSDGCSLMVVPEENPR